MEKEFWVAQKDEHKAVPYEYLGDVARGLHDFRNSIFASVSIGKDALEIGCGCGKTAEVVASVARSVTAIDEDKDAIDYAKKNYSKENLLYKYISFEDFPERKFDVIGMIESIEHIKDQNKVLEKIYRMLNTNGILFLTTPNTFRAKYRSPHHTHEFKKDEIKQFLGKKFKIAAFFGIENRKCLRFYNYMEKRREFKTRCSDVVVSTELPERSGYFLVVARKISK